jgi:hypothetical protein
LQHAALILDSIARDESGILFSENKGCVGILNAQLPEHGSNPGALKCGAIHQSLKE